MDYWRIDDDNIVVDRERLGPNMGDVDVAIYDGDQLGSMVPHRYSSG